TCSRRAARPKCNSSATAMKQRRWRKFMYFPPESGVHSSGRREPHECFPVAMPVTEASSCRHPAFSRRRGGECPGKDGLSHRCCHITQNHGQSIIILVSIRV